MEEPLTLPLSSSGKPPLEIALTMAREAGAVLMKHFERGHQEVTTKGRGNVVTQADVEAEQLIIERLREEYPEHAILAEESGAETRIEETPWMWVIDPLDGTRNFASGIGHFAVNIALCYGIEPIIGVTYDPVRDERFWATRGRGAFVNDRRLHVSEAPSVAASVLGTDLGYDDERGKLLLELLVDIFPGVQSIRVSGSAALGLAYAAAGRFDLYVHSGVYPWDLAPGLLFVAEASGTLTERDGSPATIHSEAFVAGSPAAHADFIQRTRDRPWDRRLAPPSGRSH